MKHFIFIGLLLHFIFGCKEEEIPKYEIPSNHISLITADSTKSWKLAKRFNNGHRMNMGTCFLAFRMIFNQDMTMRDNNEETKDCGKSIHATWSLTENEIAHYIKINSESLPELLNIKDTFKYFKILELSDSLMVLEFRHKQFSNNTTVITDHLVPEWVKVKDRDFHY